MDLLLVGMQLENLDPILEAEVGMQHPKMHVSHPALHIISNSYMLCLNFKSI